VDKVIYKKAYERGIYGYSLPMEYGGKGLNHIKYDQVVCEEMEKLGALDFHLAFAPSIVAQYIVEFGNEDQKRKWLPGIANGDIIPSIAITESHGGSNVVNIETSLERKMYEGNDRPYYVIKGKKVWITNGSICNIIILFVRDEEEYRKNENKGITCIVVEVNGQKDIIISEPYKKVSFEGRDVVTLQFENTMVPEENILGERGLGMAYLHKLMAKERTIIACHAVAATKVYLDVALRWSKERYVKGIQLREYISDDLAEIRAEVQMAGLFLDLLIEDWDNRDQWRPEVTAMLKFKTTEIQKESLEKIVKIFGAYGVLEEYQKDLTNFESPLTVFKAYSNSVIQTIYGGSNSAMKEVVAKSMN